MSAAEKAVVRDLRKRNGSTDPAVREEDAAAFARVAVQNWGDEAPGILARALELARAKVATWGVGKAVSS